MRMRSSTGAATRAVRSDIDKETGREGGEGEPDAERHRLRARDEGEAGEERGQRRRQPEDRLAVGRQIERDAAHRRDRQPEEEPPLLDLARERAGEGRAPVRRDDDRAAREVGPRTDTPARADVDIT